MTDYCVYALQENLSMTQELGLELMRQMNNEHQYIMECYETGVLLEADTSTETKKISLWERIKNFFKKIFGFFTDKAKNLIASNEKFITENKEKLLSKNCTGMRLEVVNYKSQDYLVRKVNEVLNELNILIKSHEKPVEELKQELDKIKAKYMDNEESLANGLKMLLRIGNPKGKLAYSVFEGSAINTKITEYIEYCSSYKDQVARINRCRTSAENACRQMDQTLNEKENRSEGTKESVFLILENCYSSDLLGFSMVTEAEEQKDDEVKPTGGSVTTSNAEEAENDTEKETKSMAGYRTFYNELFNVMQVLITSAATISEEKYHVFISKLKQILDPEVTVKVETEGKKEKKKDKKDKKKVIKKILKIHKKEGNTEEEKKGFFSRFRKKK